MYTYNYFSLEDYIASMEKYYAHTSTGRDKELLTEHMNRTKHYMELLMQKNNIEEIISNIIGEISYQGKNLSQDTKQCLFDLFINGIYLHDLGKINVNFQYHQMDNKAMTVIKENNKKHSMLSSFIYMNMALDMIDRRILDNSIKDFMYYMTFLFSFVISRHHSKLGKLSEYIEEVNRMNQRFDCKAFQEGYLGAYKKECYKMTCFNENKRDNFNGDITSDSTLYILNKMFYSLLIACDYYATYDYMTGAEIDIQDFGSIDSLLSSIVEKYRSTKVYQAIDAYKQCKEGIKHDNPFKDTPINALRSDLFLEANNTLMQHRDKQIFYLEAPTGSGKTNTSIQLALTLMEQNPKLKKLFYVFPFNTLVDQTSDTLRKSFEGVVDATILNSITPIKTEVIKGKHDQDDELVDYNKGYLNYIFLHYPLVITTHVRLFSMLFGQSREANLPLAHLANSVIIIDEIQSYNIALWKEVIYFFDLYSSILNMKIIIMSATLPRLDTLLDSQRASYINLIKNRDYYFLNPLFRERVAIDYSYVINPIQGDSIEEQLNILLNHVDEVRRNRGKTKILIEFLKTKTARLCYKLAKSKWSALCREGRIMELTGSDNKNKRKDIIDNVKEKLDDCILISTQVIEAGVDIDMDIGYKSISFLDAEEQFLGRINRSCVKPDSIAYFFDIDEAKDVYRGDYRMEQTLRDPQVREMLCTKDFTPFYSKAMLAVEEVKGACNEHNFVHTIDALKNLDFIKIEKKMTLIEDRGTIQLLLNVKEKINDEVVTGKSVWNEYINLLDDTTMSFAQKKIELSKVKAKMNYFIYSIYVRTDHGNNKIKPSSHNGSIGDIYYLEDGGRYLDEDGKFNRDKASDLFNANFNESDFM